MYTPGIGRSEDFMEYVTQTAAPSATTGESNAGRGVGLHPVRKAAGFIPYVEGIGRNGFDIGLRNPKIR
jgi:hypothetical protein